MLVCVDSFGWTKHESNADGGETFFSNISLFTVLQLTNRIYQKLDGFWIRLNRSRIDCLCLKEEKSSLMKANRNLRMKLKKYLITVNMTNGVSDKGAKSCLFMNRPSSLKIKKIERVEILKSSAKFPLRPVTCIEGHLSLSSALKKMNI
jgi:hypothetical protein